ncbi:NAD(P)H-dependent oxidoreductase [Candidatus Parcubacteria bacterium]|nr:NAD(P)H-dependent oxidoreductase [Candidatus Parcubacteria bacterium]
MKKIAVVLGTARENNFSEKVAKIVDDSLQKREIETKYVDVSDHLFGKSVSSDNEVVGKWAEIIDEVEGVIFVAPEYNHSYPGELKILIDSLYDEYKGKVAGVVSISAGQYGGVRLADKLKDLLHTVNFKLVHSEVNVSGVQKEIDEEKINKHLETLVAEMNSLV